MAESLTDSILPACVTTVRKVPSCSFTTCSPWIPWARPSARLAPSDAEGLGEAVALDGEGLGWLPAHTAAAPPPVRATAMPVGIRALRRPGVMVAMHPFCAQNKVGRSSNCDLL